MSYSLLVHWVRDGQPVSSLVDDLNQAATLVGKQFWTDREMPGRFKTLDGTAYATTVDVEPLFRHLVLVSAA